jgi:integrase
LNRALTVGVSKTEAGSGRVIPLNNRAVVTLQTWATNLVGRQPEHFVFPSEHYGFAGNDRKPHAKTVDPDTPTRDVKTAWKSAKEKAKVQCRFHDLRHTACTRLLERGTPLPVVASIMGWSAGTTAKMAKRYGHISSDVQRAAVALLDSSSDRTATSETEDTGAAHHAHQDQQCYRTTKEWAQNWAQCGPSST